MKAIAMGAALAAMLAVPVARGQDAAAAAPEPVTGTVDLGYRWLSDLQGNNQMYRSIINLGQGPRLLGADLNFRDPSDRLFDTMTLSGLGWGGDPYNTARFEVAKKKLYRFQMNYRNMAYFNAVPSFANPFSGAGVINQHAYDTFRRMVDLDLELRPGSKIVPYIGYSHQSQRGSGLTDFVLDLNEYPVGNIIRNQTDHYKGGVRFLLPRFSVTLEEGGLIFKDDEQVHNMVRNTGDRNFLGNRPFLGQSLYLGDLLQAYGMRGRAPYTMASVTGQPFSWLDVQGQFSYLMGNTDSNYIENSNGQFAQLRPLLQYTAQQDFALGSASRPHTSGIVGAEARFRKLRIIENWTTDRLHTSSNQALDRTLGTTAGGQDMSTILRADRLVDNYNQQSVDVIYEVTSSFTLRGGHRYVWGDTTVHSPSYLGGNPATGHLSRQAGVAAASYRMGARLSSNFEFEGGTADQTYYRTNLRNYNKYRGMVRFQALGSLSVTYNLNALNNDNPMPGVQLRYRSRSNGVTVEWMPNGGQRVSLMLDYARSSVRSDILYRVPQNFSTDQFPYVQNVHEGTMRLALALPAIHGRVPRLTAGGTMFLSSGSRPTHFYRPIAGIVIPVAEGVSWTNEWRWYGFDEPFYLNESFHAHQFTTGVRITR